MKVAIAGLGKSGTSALAYKVAASLPGCRVLFEPERRRRWRESAPHTVAKVIINRPEHLCRSAAFEDYDRCIVLVRDPRDRLVSHALYSWYSPLPGAEDYPGFMRLLRAKEQDPQSVDFLALVSRTRVRDSYLDTLAFAADSTIRLQRSGWYRFFYEQMVAEQFVGLESYLGVSIQRQAEVPLRYRRVARSRRSGNWRYWFTAADVATLKPHLDPVLRSLGYPDDWQLADPPSLDPATGSDYVEKLHGSRPQRLLRIARRHLRRGLGAINVRRGAQ